MRGETWEAGGERGSSSSSGGSGEGVEVRTKSLRGEEREVAPHAEEHRHGREEKGEAAKGGERGVVVHDRALKQGERAEASFEAECVGERAPEEPTCVTPASNAYAWRQQRVEASPAS